MRHFLTMLPGVDDASRHFVACGHGPDGPGLLDVDHQGRRWRVRLLHAGWQTWPRRRGRQPPAETEHHHDVHHLVLVDSGSNRFRLDGADVVAEPGTLVLVAPGQPHVFAQVDDGPIAYANLTWEVVDGERRLDLPFSTWFGRIAGCDLAPAPAVSRLDATTARRLLHLIEAVPAAARSGGPLRMLRVHEALLACCAAMVEALGLAGTDADDPLERARRHAERHLALPLAVSDLASVAGVSTGHFHRAFHARYGLSPRCFLEDLRLQAAANLLATSGLPCSRIAEAVGLVDRGRFARAFHRRFGTSPRSWRRRGSTRSE